MNRDTLTAAIVGLLDDNDILVGRGMAPSGSGWSGAPGQSAFVPYTIVWRIGSKDIRHRDLDATWDESRPMIHIRAVGATPQQADQTLDAADDVLANEPLVVAGLKVVHLRFDTSISTSKDDDVEPTLYYTGSYWRWILQEG